MSLLSLILAETGGAEPSKTPFYIAGGLLATWAVVVSVIGMKAPDFPRAGGPLRIVLAISLLLMIGATSTAVITS